MFFFAMSLALCLGLPPKSSPALGSSLPGKYSRKPQIVRKNSELTEDQSSPTPTSLQRFSDGLDSTLAAYSSDT